MRFSLRNKLLSYSIALALIPVGVAGRSMIRMTRDELKSSANEEISRTAERLATDISDLYADTWVAPLMLVASGLDNEGLGVEEKVSLVRAGIQNIADVVACQVSVEGVAEPILILKDAFIDRLEAKGLDATAVLLVDPPEIVAMTGRSDSRVVVGDLSPVQGSDEWLMTVAIPLEKPLAGRAAVLSARINLDRLRQLIASHPFNKNGAITVVDGEGRALFDPEHRDLTGLAVVAEAARLIGSQSGTVAKPYIRPTGERMLAAYSFPAGLDWAIIVERSEATAYQAVAKMSRSLSIWLIGGLGVAVLGGLFFAIRISRPVEEMATVARKVGGGDLDVRVPEFKLRDEIGGLARRINEMISGLKERDFVRETFGRYVSPEVVQKVLSDPEGLHPGGELREVTVFMSDLRGFTSLSEQLSPPQMVELLNAYLGEMSEIIDRHGGTVIEFIGDAIMALFGAPFPHEDDPLRAVACAAEMQVALEGFNLTNADRNIPPLEMGVGINTGSVIVGNIGSEKRMKYGVVGDAVNLAARAESLTVGGEVLVTEVTRNAIGAAAECRGPIEVKVKGKKDVLRLYAVVSVGEPFDVLVPAEHREVEAMTEVDLPCECFTIVDKAVAEDALKARMLRISKRGGEIELVEQLAVFDNVKLEVAPAGGDPIRDLYCKVLAVTAADGRFVCRVVFTSIPEAERPRVEALANG